jgi:UDP-N-acetylglucosamine 3-dehydrogenase
MAGKTYRVGVIGAGAIAQACHLPGYAKDDRAELTAFADPDPARHKEIRKQYPAMSGYKDHRDMLLAEKLDVVSVCSPNVYHAPQTIDALDARCHVLCEKPMATTVKDAERMGAAAKQARKKLMIGFTHRMLAGPMRCKALLDKGDIGKPFMMRVRFAHGGPYPGWAKSDWFYDPALAAGGAMLDMGIHAIDLCQWLVGPIVGVHAMAATLLKKIDVDDNALLMVEFKNNALGYIDVGWTSKPGFTGFEIYGTTGSVICDYIKGVQLCGGKASAGRDSHAEWTVLEPRPTQGGWDVEIGHWLDVVDGKEKLTMHAAAGRDALAVALAAYKSSKTGKRVAV